MRTEHRKVQITRKTAFVYLPYTWVEKNGIQKGDEIEIGIEDNKLSIRPSQSQQW
jgi:antitoxin component of MazEF toxin-antitoxin module